MVVVIVGLAVGGLVVVIVAGTSVVVGGDVGHVSGDLEVECKSIIDGEGAVTSGSANMY